MLACVFFNCVVLALFEIDYIKHYQKRNYNLKVLNIINIVFTVIYFFESILKSIYKGFIMQWRSYLRDGWSIIDIAVIITGYQYHLYLNSFRIIEIFIDATDSEPLRITRSILRPLKIVNTIPSKINLYNNHRY